jgi:hypothetical protein
MGCCRKGSKPFVEEFSFVKEEAMCHLRIVFVMMSLLAWGCGGDTYIDKGNQSYDAWIGTSKDDLVKKNGIPTRCHTFKSAGEACEWPVRLQTEAGTLTVQFDAKGNACQWTFRDLFGDRRSRSQCL